MSDERHTCEACGKREASPSYGDGVMTLYCHRCGWESGPRPASRKQFKRLELDARAVRVPPPKKRRA